MKRIWLINQWMPPSVAPTGVLLGQLADALIDRGHTVTALCRSDRDSGEQAYVRVLERFDSIPKGLIEKLSAWPRFVGACRAILRAELQRGDVLIVCSDPPLAYLPIVALAARRGAHIVHWSQDVYPEILAAYFPWLRWPLKPLQWWRNRSLRRCDATVAISDGMAQRLMPSAARILTIPNWATYRPSPATTARLRAQHGQPGELVIGYSGNLGRVHEFRTLLDAAERLRDRPVRFLITGSGPRLPELRQGIAERQLQQRFTLLPPVAADDLADALASSDAHFVSLDQSFDGLVLPSKLYGVAAAGRPIVFCGAPNGEVARLLHAFGAGIAVAQGDSAALAAAIESLRETTLRESLAAGARALLASQGLAAEMLERWVALIESL
jgi:glycosyltransferase involved in cell wall biosynthesis